MEVDEKTIQTVEKVLKEPVGAQFSEQAWKIRTNMIIASVIALVMGFANLRITADSSILGLRFAGLSDIVIRSTLAAIVLYLLLHFVWVSLDSFLEWLLRITGTRSAFQTGSFYGPDYADFPIDPRQSTLYNWWTMQQQMIGNLGGLAKTLQDTCSRWESDLETIRAQHMKSPDWGNFATIINALGETRAQAAEFAHKIEANTKAITDARIPVSLRRFDRWYEIFLRSQNLRWLLIEFLAPVALATISLYWLLK